MYYLVLTILVNSVPLNPTFSGIYNNAEACEKNAKDFIELVEQHSQNTKVLAACLKVGTSINKGAI